MSDYNVDIAEYARDLAQTVEDLTRLAGYTLAEYAEDQPDHAKDIADRFGYTVDAEVETGQLVSEWAFDIEHYRSTTHANKVITKLLLEGNGPTVRVTIRPDDSAELFHSWGTIGVWDSDERRACDTWEMPDGFGEQLRQLVGPWG